MNNITAGQQLLSNILAIEDKKKAEGEFRQLNREWFEPSLTEMSLYDGIQSFMIEAKTFPSYTEYVTLSGSHGLVAANPQLGIAALTEQVKKNYAWYLFEIEKKKALNDRQELGKSLNILLKKIQNIDNHNTSVPLFQVSQEVLADVYSTEASKVIYTGFPSIDNYCNGFSTEDLIIFSGRPGSGKAQPLDSPVLMADGSWKKMGELKTFDALASLDGEQNLVMGKYPQGKKQVYKITFSDGSWTEACGDHLWRVHSRHWKSPQELPTSKVKRLIEGTSRYKNRLYIDVFDGEFGSQTHVKGLDPYLLGVLLGDGGLTQNSHLQHCITISSADRQTLDNVRTLLPDGLKLEHHSNYDYVITCGETKVNPVRTAIRQLGLHDKTSHTKFIPQEVFLLNREGRLKLLQGLMDTGGTITKENSVTYSTVSWHLAKDVTRLIQSLGFIAVCRKKKSGNCEYYNITLRTTHKDDAPFQLKRKLERYTTPRQVARRNFKVIEFSRETECQCIAVSHPSSLYVTNDYIVTHNTYQKIHLLEHLISNNKRFLFGSLEMSDKQLVSRLMSCQSHVSAGRIRAGHLPELDFQRLVDSTQHHQNYENGFLLRYNKTMTGDDLKRQVDIREPEILIVDASYLLKVGRATKQFDKLQENIEFYKDLQSSYRIPIVITCQLNRAAEKDKKSSDKEGEEFKPTLEYLYGADTIGQMATIVFMLVKMKGSDEHKFRKVYCVKNRDGSEFDFVVNHDFDAYRFGEYNQFDPANMPAAYQRFEQ